MGDLSLRGWPRSGPSQQFSLALWVARGEREERLRRELRQQAVRISAWFVEMHKDPQGEDPQGEDPQGEDSQGEDSPREAWLPPELRGRAADVELLNNSADPVTDVLVFLSRVSYKVQRWWGSRSGVSSHDRCASTRTMDHQRA